MNHRIGLRFILIAVALGTVIVVAGIVIGRMRGATSTASWPSPSIEMPLAADGAGHQRVANMELAYRVSPYPGVAAGETTLTLKPTDLRLGAKRTVTGTLEVAPATKVDGRVYDFVADGDTLVVRGRLFDAAGEYRLRARLWGVFPDETYVTVMAVTAR